MALTYVGFTTGQRGIEADETGINTEGFSCRYFPAFKDKVTNYQGQVRGWCIPNILSREVNITGKVVSGASGIMAATFVTALTLANDVADFLATTAAAAGGMYVDEVTIDQTNEGWRTVNMKLSSEPLVS